MEVGELMECYNDFAYIYDELIAEDVNYKTWCNTIIDICNDLNIEKRDYLDLACGTGNFSSYIGKNFAFTTAVDLSSSMLSVADEKLKEEGIRSKVVCQDICNLSLNKKFDLITCGLDSTNYIIEEKNLKSYFKGVSQHLRENGIFIFDVNTEYKIKEVLGNNSFNYNEDDVVYIWENILQDDVVTMELTFFVKKGQVYERFDETHIERAYSESYLESCIKEVGMKVEKKLNCYEDKLIDDKTERIAFVIRKDEKSDDR